MPISQRKAADHYLFQLVLPRHLDLQRVASRGPICFGSLLQTVLLPVPSHAWIGRLRAGPLFQHLQIFGILLVSEAPGPGRPPKQVGLQRWSPCKGPTESSDTASSSALGQSVP